MTTTSFRPYDGTENGIVSDTSPAEVTAVVARAADAAATVNRTPPAVRRDWLRALAAALRQRAGELVTLADSETGMGQRLAGEVARAAAQLEFYGDVAAEGSYLGVSIDDPSDIGPRLVRANRALGPVAVFGASNFPFAFGVLGNDTGSALAAGCPVVVKAHPAHPLLSVRLGELAEAALRAAGAPEGVFGLVSGMTAGVQMVAEPGICAVGFTGSQRGGLALWRIANERRRVIPVYAEMGTVNPVVVTERAAATRLEEIASGFVGSFTLGQGQFCTKPGMLFVPTGHDGPRLVAEALETARPVPVMLTSAIAAGVLEAIPALEDAGGTVLGRVRGPGTGWSADAVAIQAPLSALASGSRLLEECFGPVAIVVEYDDCDQLTAALSRLQGSLAAAVFGADAQDPDIATWVAQLAHQSGRVTVGDWPTGATWTWAQNHSGPWPATSNPLASSLGAAALDRWIRPVTLQSVPDHALPEDVRLAAALDNPWHIARRRNGVLELPA